jgi:hypothetical protein
MSANKKDSPSRRVVGIYDRPASADRSRARVVWIVVAVAIAVTGAWILYLR